MNDTAKRHDTPSSGAVDLALMAQGMERLAEEGVRPDEWMLREWSNKLRSIDSEARRGADALRWAVSTFGEIAEDKEERAMRFIEEAVELVYAIGLTSGTLAKIANRVYGRPRGERWQEVGQAQLTLELLAEVYGINPQLRAAIEFERIQAIPKEEWERRHQAKVTAGIAK